MERRKFLQVLGSLTALLPSSLVWASPIEREAAREIVTSAPFRTWSSKIMTLVAEIRETRTNCGISDLFLFTRMEQRASKWNAIKRFPDRLCLKDEDGCYHFRTKDQWEEVSKQIVHDYLEPALANAGVIFVSHGLNAIVSHAAFEPISFLPDRDLFSLRRGANPNHEESWARIVVHFDQGGADLSGWRAPRP